MSAALSGLSEAADEVLVEAVLDTGVMAYCAGYCVDALAEAGDVEAATDLLTARYDARDGCVASCYTYGW